ncbi:MAG: LysM peptidoglycan-binding domain-containing protein [Aquaticitalea sp.]
MIKTKRLFKVCMLFFLFFQFGISQVNTKKHTVSLGETIIEIAKKYNVTPYDILQANLATLNSLDDIKENDVLTIPESKINSPQLESAADVIKSSVAKQNLTYTVKKGETKFSLAKRFGMSIAELEALNPQIVSGLNEGHVLKISTNVAAEQPVEASTDELAKNLNKDQTLTMPQNKQKAPPYDTYVVKYGDTKYSLSKKYETTIEELEQLNPQIVPTLQAGLSLRIPSKYGEKIVKDKTSEIIVVTETPRQTPTESTILTDSIQTTNKPLKEEEKVAEPTVLVETEKPENTILEPEKNEPEAVPQETQMPSTKAYINYEVQPKETLYGLAKKAGMSINDFVALNPQLKESVQIGMMVKMPNTGEISKENAVNQKPVTNLVSSPYKDLTKTITTSKSEKVAMFLPFNEAQFNEEAHSSKELSSVSDDFKREHLEFYSGAKIALDSIKKLGLNVEITILEAEDDKRNSKLLDLAKEQHLETYDALVLPFYGNSKEELAKLVAEQRVPVITAAPIAHLQNVDNVFGALPSINEQRKKMLDFMLSKQGNIIVVSDMNRSESKDFIASYAPTVQFINIKNNGNFYDDDLIALLKQNQMNYVILDSDRNSVFLNVTNILLSEMKSYKLQLAVLEPTLIPDTDDVSVKRYRILKMLFPSLSTMETNTKLENFSKTYKKVYDISPSTNAILGFDITFDTLLRLAQTQSFEESAKNDITEYVNLKFDYKKTNTGGYNNEGIYILQYDTDTNIREAE